MIGPERALRRILTSNLSRPDWEFTPIESRGTIDGIPDCFWANRISRGSGWLELKHTLGWKIDLRPHQVAWLSKHAKAGVSANIVVRQAGVGRDGEPRDVLWLLAGSHAARWANEGLPQGLNVTQDPGVLGRYTGGPRQWKWAEFGAALLNA